MLLETVPNDRNRNRGRLGQYRSLLLFSYLIFEEVDIVSVFQYTFVSDMNKCLISI